MRFDVLTLFPEMFEAVLGESIIGRARSRNIIELNFINIRDFSEDKHRRVDDYPYGGGSGMVMQPMPIYNAYKSIIKDLSHKPKVIYLTPQGKVFTQSFAKELANEKHLILLCGHYEGIDERIIEEIVDIEISIGDFVLTGGEIPAMAVIDAICRLIPGVLGQEESFRDESHFSGLLEYPQYTRPPEFLGKKVPEVLLSGHHANIQKWRREQSVIRTYMKRPDLLEKAPLSDEDRKLLNNIKKD
ncbi:MAG: tRNA (guanine37-N1)-methyltransferase [Petroclostridium sp.]|jgi:tRNA (guanine37-N1)-methyltransferase|uniref:tRNA (guanosine(37)-N1)-methyltransferase TrmD n=1 Tax=Petroclostridium xylanilyticum TaxID=1792311 RepID=UPI000B99CABE|nr:tRNA (guanosine(37)-N1)-methyltransferase TrmD [Petroclostridium xylanilyticum]MBZ4646231.1 trmD [Clostridia bacterium]MDK2810108.1 tRNA (guanine37-N1)-methyltransferase [Petroclostridium sp.]